MRDFIVRNATPYTGDEKFLAAPSARTKAVWDKLQPYFQEEQKKGVLAADAKTPSTLLAHKPGYIDQKNEIIVGLQTDQPFKRAIFPYGGLRMVEAGLKAAGIEADPQVHEAFTKYRKTHNDGVFDAYTAKSALPQVRHHHRLAGRLWPRPHHRRLPARRALWRRPSARGQAGRAPAGRRHVADGRDHPRARGTGRADARAEGPRGDGEALWLRHHAAGGQCAGSGPVDLFRLSRRDQGGQRRGDVDRPHLDLPRYLHRARPEGRHARRGRRPGIVGPARAEAAHRALPAHAGLRRAVQRRSLLGDRMRRRHGPERPAAGDQEQLSHAAHADQSRAGAGAQHHRALVEEPAGELQALLREDQQGYVVAAVRERRPDAALSGATTTPSPAASRR